MFTLHEMGVSVEAVVSVFLYCIYTQWQFTTGLKVLFVLS